MSWELDHVFFACVDADAAERELAAFGFAFTVRRDHPGQGTANACAMFENAFFELLRPRDLDELNSELVGPLGLAERFRWQETGACPFGLCFRPTGAPTDPETWPFDTWDYAPPYVPAGKSIPIVTPPHALSEPIVFISNRPAVSPSAPIAGGALPGGTVQSLTGVRICCPRADASSPAVRWFSDHGFFSIEEGPELRLNLELNHGSAGLTHSFRPKLPIDVSC